MRSTRWASLKSKFRVLGLSALKMKPIISLIWEQIWSRLWASSCQVPQYTRTEQPLDSVCLNILHSEPSVSIKLAKASLVINISGVTFFRILTETEKEPPSWRISVQCYQECCVKISLLQITRLKCSQSLLVFSFTLSCPDRNHKNSRFRVKLQDWTFISGASKLTVNLTLKRSPNTNQWRIFKLKTSFVITGGLGSSLMRARLQRCRTL